MQTRPGSRRILAGTAGLAMAVTGFALVVPSASANPAGTDLVISEFYGGGGNTGAPFKNDFIELYNPTGAAIDLTGYTVEYFAANGNSGGSHALTGSVPAGKHWLVQEGAGAGTAPALPTPDSTGGLNMAASNGSVQLARNGVVVDLVGSGSATRFEGTSAPAMNNTTSINRSVTGADTDNNSADFSPGAPSPTPSGGSGPVDPPDPVGETLTIAEIQGTGATSPKVGVVATTTGVVTAKYPTGGFNGFYVQTGGPDTTPDASDGLFVFMGTKSQDGFAVGDTVTVTGPVSEFGSMTQVSPAAVGDVALATTAQPAVVPKTQVPGTDCALPGTGCLTGPALEAAKEKSEGELFAPTGAFTVTDIYDGSAYVGGSPSSSMFGEIGLAAGSTPLFTPTDVVDPHDSAAIAARVAWNNAHRVVLDDGSSTNYTSAANTGRPFPWFTTEHQPRVGAAVTFPGGVVLDYRFSWKLQPTSMVSGAPTATQPQFEQTRKATPEAIDGTVKLATFNVLNYFTTLGDQVAGCTSFTDRDGAPTTTRNCPANGPRGAWDAANFARQQTKIVKAVNALGADVVSLEEIENNRSVNGGDRDASVRALVTALNADAGGTTPRWAYVPSPAETPATEDVIRTGFIYNPATVETVGESKILIGEAAFNNARQPLAQAFKPKGAAADQTFAAIVNHFKSKGSGVDDGTGQGNANPDRVLQARALATFAAAFAASAGTDKVFLTGDFNAYSQEDPVKELEAAGYVNLESTTNPAERSYSFDGASGSLDHVFASPGALEWVKGVDIWEINANETVYNQYGRYNTNITNLYQPNVFSASDHNPEIVGFSPVSKATPTIEVKAPGMFNVGKASKVRVEVSARGATPTGTVTVEVNGTEFTSTLVKGKAKVDVTINQPGTALLRVTYSGSETVHAASTTLAVRVH